MGIPHPVPVNVPVNARAPTLLVPGGLLSTATGCGPVQSSAPCGRDRNAMPTCPATVKFLDAQPEAHLLDPGSTMIGGVSGSGQRAAGSGQRAAGSGQRAAARSLRGAEPGGPQRPWPPRRHAGTRGHRLRLVPDVDGGPGWHPAGTSALGPLGLSNEGAVKGTRASFVDEDSHVKAAGQGYPWAAKEANKTIYDVTFIIEPYTGR